MNTSRFSLRALGATVGAVLVLRTSPAYGQWSAAPTVAVGLAVPGGELSEAVAEGATGKIGLWMRAPRVPVGFTSELMYTYFRGGRTQPPTGNMWIAAAIANVTTRRHERRLEPYGTLGAGWYRFGDPDERFTASSAPGVNVGLGELIAYGGRDFFVDIRFHAMRTRTTTGRTWTTFLPIMMGLRF